jgi:hypothetical protein
MVVTGTRLMSCVGFFVLALLLALCASNGCSEEKGITTSDAANVAAPAPGKAQATPAPTGTRPSTALRADQLATILLAQFPEYDECPRPDDPGALRYAAHSIDLNDDSKPEVIALTLGREACGSGGCTAFVLQDGGTDYQVLTRITTVSLPIKVAESSTAGWRDLIVDVSGGGSESGARVLQYNGRSYPENASLAPQVTKDTRAVAIIADASGAIAHAIPLVPTTCPQDISVTATETLGGFGIGMASKAIKKVLGPPVVTSKPELWEADGLYHQTWSYPNAGVVARLSATTKKGPWKLSSITLKAPGRLTTARGIGIGASRKEVLATYGHAAQAGTSAGPQHRTLIVGSEYDGLVFRFDNNDKVEQIFLGAAAE